MSKYVIDDTTLSGIADAIRAKTGKADSMTPEQMPTEISGITGGKEEQVKTVTITENGSVTVMPDEGKALSSVEITVAVEAGSSADVRYVAFMNGDTVLYKKAVAVGDDCVDVLTKGLIETPTKESTAQYDYTYYGWGASDNGAADSTILQNITEDKTVYAIYTATVRYYTITWLDDDGVTVLHTESLPYGSVPSYEPTKDGYMLSGWNPSISTVTGNATYTAVWEEAGVKWKLENGTLTYYGQGAIDDYATIEDRPWVENIDTVTAIVVEDGITHIGKYAFYNCVNAQTVIIGDSVTSIGLYAFAKCSGLASITIPDGVVKMEGYTFQGCTGLTGSVTIPNSVTTMGAGIFDGCSGITELNIPNNITIIPSRFARNTKITSLTIPRGVTHIDSEAFKNTGITSLTIPSTVTKLGYGIIAGTNVTSVTFEETYRWWYCNSTSYEGGTAVSSSNISNKTTAATYLTSTYVSKWWYRTDT